jgi:hypothetical protein
MEKCEKNSPHRLSKSKSRLVNKEKTTLNLGQLLGGLSRLPLNF